MKFDPIRLVWMLTKKNEKKIDKRKEIETVKNLN